MSPRRARLPGLGQLTVALLLAALACRAPEAPPPANAPPSLRDLVYPGPEDLTLELFDRFPAEVSVLFVVEADGSVQDAQVESSTDPLFEQAALATVRRWHFEPGRRDGQPAPMRMRVPVRFVSFTQGPRGAEPVILVGQLGVAP